MTRKALGMKMRSSRPQKSFADIPAFAPLVEAASRDLRRPVPKTAKPVHLKAISFRPKTTAKPKKRLSEIPLKK